MPVIATVEQLEAIYGQPNEASTVKVADRIRPQYRVLIDKSPFAARATDGADPGPHYIGRAERQRFKRNGHQAETERDLQRGRSEPGEPVGILQAEGPGDLKQSRRQKCQPSAHGVFDSGGSVSTAYWA
jgi:predicted pyridoxine 5'-phosphate oxidase superfamily flavin-nucleotide-binding protein